MEFPHIGDTNFPIINNVNVYAYRNEFDYTRWGVNTRVKLTNVLWNSDYNDVVLFDSDTERDEWFDENADVYNVTLDTSRQIAPEGGIKLPIPYDVAVRYNYMVVDVQPMTSDDRRIAYETDYGVRRWYFFIDTIESRAPNTSRFVLSLDVWTQYQHDIEINYLFLERGHAPVAATDVDTYLNNPIANNEYLLTPDVTPSRSTVTRSSRFVPFGSGAKWICFASTVGPSQLANLGTVTHNDPEYSSSGTLTFSDYPSRAGHQLTVDGFGMGNGDNYSNLHLRTTPMARYSADNRIYNNVSVYAFPATDASFVSDVIDTCPNFLNSVQGCFVIDTSMFDIIETYTLAGHELHHVKGTDITLDIGALDKSMFGYPNEYQRFTKLYTMPYASIQLTDNDGKTVDVAIEDTGDVRARKIVELAFPYVKTRMLFDGIGGVGSTAYQWTKLNGVTDSLTMSNADWFEYCFDNDIPCYALYMDGEQAWYLDNFNRTLRTARNNALVQYHSTMRSANTQRENVIDSDDTMVTNTAADATTLTTNTANTGRTAQANTTLTIANNSDKATFANTTSNTMNLANESKARDQTNAANLATVTTSQADRETTAATALSSSVGNVLGAIGGTAAGMAMAGGALGSVVPGAGNLAGAAGGLAAGAMIGTIQAVANAGSAGFNASIITQANSVTTSANVTANVNNLAATLTNNSSLTTQGNTQRTYNTNHDNTLLDKHTDNNVANNNTNAGNTAATMNANAGRTKTTQDSNATYTREAVEANAKETLRNSRYAPTYAMYDARNASPRPVGAYAGDPTADYMRTRGVQLKVRTMPDSEVRQVGDWFARYGYALEQVWDVTSSGLCPMRHFCYWKCRDAWVDDRKSSNNAVQQLIVAMFDRGVTIWKNPDEVGRVSIYDN